MRSFSWLMFFWLLSASGLSAQQYEVVSVSEPIRVDGLLDEAAWKAAPRIERFVDNMTGEDPGPQTEAVVLYDDKFIYFGFEVEDENIWSTFTERDQHLWTEEVVEVFIQADPAHPSYIELEVNPLGTMIDIYLLDIRKPLKYESWNSSGLRWAVDVRGTVDGKPGDRGWSCEIALPLDDVVTAPHNPPRPGDRWKANLYRVERYPERKGLAWTPTRKPDFHLLSAFGEFVFSDRKVP